VAGEAEYAFAHVLIRDVAYGQIPRRARADKHRRAAEWIEALGRSDDHAEMLAHHYLSALELARAAGGDTDALEESARIALRNAGDRAFALNAYAAAARHYRDALELWPPDDRERPFLLFCYGRTLYVAEGAGLGELTEASELLAEVDPETAAEAEIMLAVASQWRMSRADMQSHLARASELVAAAPASRGKAYVLCTASRFHMIAAKREDAIRVGREALHLAEELDLPDIRAHALNNIGTSRAAIGDPTGIDDLELSIAIAKEANFPDIVVRGYLNLSSLFWNVGEIARAMDAVHEALRVCEQFGVVRNVPWFLVDVANGKYWHGEWDEAVNHIDKAIHGLDHTASLQYAARLVRGRIRLARGEQAGAAEDAARALELARSANHPQSLLPSLVLMARVACAEEAKNQAAALADETLQLVAEIGFQTISSWFAPELVAVLRTLGRQGDFLPVARRATARSRWFDAAETFDSAEFGRAAELYAEIGSLPDEAYARLCAAEQLIEESRRAEADEQLERALAFWRSVGATRYIREAETLLAATV
jgi:hypothetical protein